MGLKKFWVRKKFGCKRKLGLKKFGFKKLFNVCKTSWVHKKFWVLINLESVKNVGPKISKVQKKFGGKKLGSKNV